MFEFQVPEDLTGCSEEDIQECITQARDEFGLLNESEDISNETLERMTELADGIEAFHREIESRSIKLATHKRTALVKQMKDTCFSSLMASYKVDTVSKRDQLAARMGVLMEKKTE